MKHPLNQRHAKTVAEFREIVQDVWELHTIDPLGDLYGDRLQGVLTVGGQCLSPWLSGDLSGLSDRLAKVQGGAENPGLWTPDEDLELARQCRAHLNKWEEITAAMNAWRAHRDALAGHGLQDEWRPFRYDRNDVVHRARWLVREWEKLDLPILHAWCPVSRQALLEDAWNFRIVKIGIGIREEDFVKLVDKATNAGFASDGVEEVATAEELRELMG
jgi:hypothetical protein